MNSHETAEPKSIDIVMSHTDNGFPKFSAKAQDALLYQRGSIKKCTNIFCPATIEVVVQPTGATVGVWARGVHVTVLLDDVLAVVETAIRTAIIEEGAQDA